MLWRQQDAVQCQAVENSVCIAFLLIPSLGKNEWTLLLIQFQTVSVKTLSLAHFILAQICLQINNLTQDFQKDWN